jgi:hypothetical protein
MFAIFVPVLINLVVGLAINFAIGFFTSKPDTGKINDLGIPRSEWGSPIVEVFGSYKVTGNLIWGQDKIETKSGGGGKGGGGGGATYGYKGNFAVLLAQGSEDMKLSRLWLNKKIVYDRSADPASIPATQNNPPSSPNDGDRYTVGTAPTGAWVGQEAQIAQWNSRLGDWDFYPAASTSGEVSDRSSQYFRFYSGSATQNPDSLIESVKGVGNTSAYRYRSYIVFEGLPLTDSQGSTFDFGGNFPQVEAELVSNGAVDGGGFVTRPKILVSEIITRICAKNGIPSMDIDVSQITDQINGFAILAQETGSESLSKLANIFQFDFTEGEKITFRPVSRSVAKSIPFADLATHEFGQTRPENYTEEITETLQLPREIKFNYRDFQLDHRNNIVYARRQTASQTQNSESFQADIVLDRIQAQTSVNRTLIIAWTRRATKKYSLPLAYSELEAGDRITIDNGSDTEDIVIARLESTANHLINIDCFPYIGFSDSYAPPITNSTVPPSTIISQGDTRLYLLDIPLISNSDADNTLYAAANGTVNGWRGCGVFVSRDLGSNYEVAKQITGASTVANASNTLGNFTGSGTDNTNTLTVVLESGTSLESTTATNLPFTNHALIGSEIIRFTTATLTAAKTYQLSGLIRGDRGTEWAIATHAANEKFYLLSTVSKIQGSLSDIGVARLFKAPTSDQTLGTVPATTFTTTGKCLEPLAPLPVSAYKPANDIIINFARRDRHDYGATGTVKLSEFDERYEIDIFNGASVVRTIATTSPTATYTQAQQITDFGSAQIAIVIKVYQLSKDVGRGFAGSYSSGTLGTSDPVTYPTITSTTSSVANTAQATASTAQATANSALSGLATKQDILVSGTNIKTINGNSLLGSGDLVVSGGSGGSGSGLYEWSNFT